jgi:hypothetical protein
MGFFEEYFGWIIGGIITTLLIVFIWALISLNENHNRLMAQCMADGKKEYECVALLDSKDTTFIPMPIIIPTGR